MNALVSLILVASMLLGGGATVAAAQDDLPTQSLYQLKLWTENATLAMKGDPQEQANLLMSMAQTRTQEMAALVEQGVKPPDRVRERLEQHLNQILQLAADMDGIDCEQTLLQLRERLQTQDQLMQQLQIHASPETEPLLTQTRQMLQTHLRMVEAGMADPQGLRYIMQNQMRYGQEEEATPEPNQQGEPAYHQNGQQNGTDEPPNVVPGNQESNGNNTGNEAHGGPNPDMPQNGDGKGGSGNEAPGGPKPERPKDGSGSGSGSGGDGGNGPGMGGKN